MSLSRIPSSVGSKSSNTNTVDDDRQAALRSSWISRLNLRPLSHVPSSPPPPLAPRSELQGSLDSLSVGGEIAAEAYAVTSEEFGAVGLSNNNNKYSTISSGESRTRTPMSNLSSGFAACGSLNLMPRVPPRRLLLPRKDQLFSGFGPYQVGAAIEQDGKGFGNFPLFRRMARLGEEVGDGLWEKVGFCEERRLDSIDVVDRNLDESDDLFHQRRDSDNRCNGVKLSPFFHMRPHFDLGWWNQGMKRMMDHSIAEEKGELFGNQGYENRHVPLPISYYSSEKTMNGFPCSRLYDQRIHNDPWNPGSSTQHMPMSRGGAAYFDGTDDSVPRTMFHDPLSRNQSTANHQLNRSILVNEPEEPFSFWNMGRVKRRDIVSSVPPSVSSTWNLNRKRNTDLGNILPRKSRKKGNDE